MTIIASIDGPNRLIHLHADTVGVDLHPMDVYKEMRTLRRNTESLRRYDRFLDAAGNVSKGGGKFTERYVIEKDGTRIVPHDTAQNLNVIGTIITDDGQEGVACFDRSPLAAVVDINYVPPQVEVITIVTGSGVLAQDIIDIVDAVWDEPTADHVAVGSTGEAVDSSAIDIPAIVDAILDEDITTHNAADSVGKAIIDGDATSITVDNAAIADAVWDEALSGHLTPGSTGAKLNDGSALDLDSIADAVWTELLAPHVSGGNAAAYMVSVNAIDTAALVDAIWDEEMSYHTNADSAGFYMGSGLVATTDNAAIAAAVWDTLLASHVTPLTFGTLQDGLSSAAIAAAVTADMDLNSNLLSVIRTAVETDIPATLAGLNDFDPVTDEVMLVNTVTTNTDMRGTDNVWDAETMVTALHAVEFNARKYDKVLQKVTVYDGALLTDLVLYEWNTSTSALLTTMEPV